MLDLLTSAAHQVHALIPKQNFLRPSVIGGILACVLCIMMFCSQMQIEVFVLERYLTLGCLHHCT